MTALTALASATFETPESGETAGFEPVLRAACSGAWRAVEVVLAADVLRGRIAKAREARVRDGIDAVLGLFPNVNGRPAALASLRAAREAGAFDGPLDIAAAADQNKRRAAGDPTDRAVIDEIRRSLSDYPDLATALADAELCALLVDTARAVFRIAARGSDLARWSIGPTGVPARDHALAAFAVLVEYPAALDELELLISLPIHLDENVQFTVYRPRSIDPGRWHPLLAFAHLAERRPDEQDLPDPVEEVRRQAEAVLGDRAKAYQPVTQDSGAAIPSEGELTFVPEIAGIEFNPPRRSFVWLEPVHREEFRMRAAASQDGKTLRGRLTVFLGSIVIAEVPLNVRIDAARPEPTMREPVNARTYRKIFASYSHRDLDIVNQFESYARVIGDEYLRDWIHLRTGEVWNDRLLKMIDDADAFQLFWSHNSMHSKFVRQEYEHAIALNRQSFVRPTYWEDPMPTAPGLPPENLSRLHFQKIARSLVPSAPVAAHPPPGLCTRCGKENAAHYQFCLGCGAELTQGPKPSGDMGMMKTMMGEGPMGMGFVPSQGLPRPPSSGCSMCGHSNPLGSAFCLNCGSSLASAAQTAVPGSTFVCGVCRSDNPPGLKFCRSCGSALAAASPQASPGPAATIMMPSPITGSPGASSPPRGGSPGAWPTTPMGSSTITCPRCGASTPSSFPFCQQCGLNLQTAPRQIDAQGASIDAQAATLAADPAPRLTGSVASQPARSEWGALVLQNRDGSDGQRFPLHGEYIVVGRRDADIEFSDDRFLANQHARFERTADGGVEVHPIDAVNGVYRKIDAAVELGHGATILVGNELLRFELVVGVDVRVLVRDDLALFGSQPRDVWGRLMSIIAGGFRDVRYLAEREIVIGREEGDIVFGDDAFMSRRHAVIEWDGKRARVADLGSANGTFVRIDGPTRLAHGDHVRLGDQLLRVELR